MTRALSIGYVKGNSKVNVRSAVDIDDVWSMILT